MISFEYKVVPAPKKGQRGKGLRSAEQKFANAVQVLMNEMGTDGWEYQRSDTLPSEERQGLTGRTKVFRTLLVFRRQVRTGPDRVHDLAREVAGLESPGGHPELPVVADPPLTLRRVAPDEPQATPDQTPDKAQATPDAGDAAQLRDTLSESLSKNPKTENAKSPDRADS